MLILSFRFYFDDDRSLALDKNQNLQTPLIIVLDSAALKQLLFIYTCPCTESKGKILYDM